MKVAVMNLLLGLLWVAVHAVGDDSWSWKSDDTPAASDRVVPGTTKLSLTKEHRQTSGTLPTETSLDLDVAPKAPVQRERQARFFGLQSMLCKVGIGLNVSNSYIHS